MGNYKYKLLVISMMKLQRMFETNYFKEIERHQLSVVKLTTVINCSQKSSDITDKKIDDETFDQKEKENEKHIFVVISF